MKNTIKNFLFIFTVAILLSSCAFNNSYVSPLPFKKDTPAITINPKTADSTKIVFSKTEGKEPTFIKSGTTLYQNIEFKGVFFTNKAGNRLHGYLLKSKIVPSNNTTILHFRGAGGGIMLNQFQAIESLLQFGYEIMIFDYAGFGFSEGKATRRTVLDDGQAALKHLKSIRNNSKIVIYGQSHGGTIAIAVAEKNEDKFDALVSEGAFSSHKDIAKNDSGLGGYIFVKEMYSAKNTIKKITRPVLVIHSKDDDVIPYWMGKKIYENANQPKTFMEINGKHLEGPKLVGKEISDKISEILK